MTSLQHRILARLSSGALTPKTLYRALDTDPANAIDFAVRALVKAGEVVFRMGHLQRVELIPPITDTPIRPRLTPGGRPKRSHRRPSPSDELTLRQEEVAELAARGLTRRQIAERLKITAKAVSSHLTAVYIKRGGKAREGLAGIATATGE